MSIMADGIQNNNNQQLTISLRLVRLSHNCVLAPSELASDIFAGKRIGFRWTRWRLHLSATWPPTLRQMAAPRKLVLVAVAVLVYGPSQRGGHYLRVSRPL